MERLEKTFNWYFILFIVALIICGILVEPIENSILSEGMENNVTLQNQSFTDTIKTDNDIKLSSEDKPETYDRKTPNLISNTPQKIVEDNIVEFQTEITEQDPDVITTTEAVIVEEKSESNNYNIKTEASEPIDVTSTSKSHLSPELTSKSSDKNSAQTTDDHSSAPATTKSKKTIHLGSDNPEYPGHAMGNTHKAGSYYYMNSLYYAYAYVYGTSEYRSWAVFDLEDLSKWEGVKVTNVKLKVLNYYMYYFDRINLTILNTTPYHDALWNTKLSVFNESGPTGIQIGQHNLTSVTNTTRAPFEVDLNQLAVGRMNSIITNSTQFYTFAIGMHIAGLQSPYYYGIMYWTDLRLVVTFEYTKEIIKTKPNQGIAFGDDLVGYVYKSTTYSDYPLGYTYVVNMSTQEYRSYMHWETDKIKSVIMVKNHTKIHITRVSLRFNHHESRLKDLYVYRIVNNVTVATAERIFNDTGDGTKYFGPISLPNDQRTECDWDLGFSAVFDLQFAMDNDTIDYFAIGMITTSVQTYSRDFGAKLVIEWADRLPVHNIDKDTHYASIQTAIYDANSGNTIVVENGTYDENVIINKPIKLIGENRESTFINGSGLGDTVNINADGVRFSGFTITNSGTGSDDAGIELEGAKNCIIANNNLIYHSSGILLDGGINVRIENNSFISCGLLILGDQLENWNTHTISLNNTVNGKPIVYWKNVNYGNIPAGAGQIIIGNCSNINIQYQNLNHGTIGLTLGFSNHNLIINNSCMLNKLYGIYLINSKNNTVSNCNSSENRFFGIGLDNSTNNIIENNNLSLNEIDGIYLLSSSNNTINNNYCNQNYNGITLELGFNNTVIDNTCSNNLNTGIQNIVIPGINIKKIPVDVVLALDTSGSMADEIDDLKIAAKNFVNHPIINEQDRIAIYYFSYNSRPALLQPFTVCNSTGKTILVNQIDTLLANSGTPIWDTIGESLNYLAINGSERTPFLIAMTDGGDTSSVDYAPWHNESDGTKQYRDIDGISGHDYLINYYNPELESNWNWKNFGTNGERRDGLLNIVNTTIFTVGLGLPHRNHSNDSCWRFPNGWMGSFAQYESVVNNWVVNRNSSIYQEAGSPEFNLWRIANTSEGEYFYADKPDKLNPIFQRLVILLKKPTIDVNSTITGNEVMNNKYGIYTKGSKKMNISNNDCYNNEYGIKLDSASDDNLILENMIMNNTNGISIINSKNNTIYHNNFIKNGIHSIDNAYNTWNASYPIGGNYWDTWTTPDIDDDGFVDLPYNVSGGTNKDYLPFAKENGWANHPPTQPEIEVTPNIPYTDDDLSCTITVPSTDEDGDTVTYIYEWYRNQGIGFILQEGLTEVTVNLSVSIYSSLTLKNEIWRCIVTPYDGQENGTSAQDQVNVINSPPTAPVIEVSPAKPYTSDDLVCTVISQATDLDFDIITYTYQWYCNNGSGFILKPGLTEVTTALSVTIFSTNTKKHETWRCVVTPNDGTVNGPADLDQTIIINTPPKADINSPQNGTVNIIGHPLYFESLNSSDADNDALVYEWDFDYDGLNFDVNAVGKNVSHTWTNPFDGVVALRVKDNDGDFDIDVRYIISKNIAPKVNLKVLPLDVKISIRIAGEKWHDVVIELYEDDTLVANGSLTRYPGSPNDQMLNLTTIKVNISKVYSAIIRYTPEDDPVNGQPNGATPCWVIAQYQNGEEVRLHHTFNVQQPKSYVWEVNLTKEVQFNNITFQATAFDLGPDELTFFWDFGDGINISKFYSNNNLTYPVQITKKITHEFTFSGTYTITLTVKDNHGGATTVKLSIIIG